MKPYYLFIISLSLFLSCKKEKIDVDSASYFPLEIGNYWTYQNFEIDTSGNETLKPLIDSIIISRDTIINENQYYILEGNYDPYNGGRGGIIRIIRDSAGYLVNQNGIILFSRDNFSDILEIYSHIDPFSGDTIYNSFAKMEVVNDPVTVPAGTFRVLNYKRTITSTLEYPGIENPRYSNTYYAENIGIVLDTYFYLQGTVINEKRLWHYHIAK